MLWPDFSRADLESALAEFDARKRPLRRAADGEPPRRPPRAPHRAARTPGSDLVARILVAVPAIAFAIGIIYSGGAIVRGRGARCSAWSASTSCSACYERVRPVRLAGFLGIVGLVAAAALGDEHQVLLALVRRSCPCSSCSGGDAGARADPAHAGHGDHARRLWVGLALAYAVLLRGSPTATRSSFMVLVGTFIGDTGAYLGGRAFGTRRLAPRVSPNKTVGGAGDRRWSGASSRSGAPAAPGLALVAAPKALLLGVAVGVAAPLGDLFESQIKRDAGAKDTGGLFGAHGGALDRLDAALFTLDRRLPRSWQALT